MAKKKTPTENQRDKYKRWSKVCFGGEFVSVFTPFFTIGIVNYEKYFIQYDGTKISIGFALAMVVMGIATFLVAKKNFTQSFVTLLIGWGACTGILFLIKELLTDLCYIMLFGWLGIFGAYGLDVGKKKLKDKADTIQKRIDIANDQNAIEQFKAEQEEIARACQGDSTTVKIKIKK